MSHEQARAEMERCRHWWQADVYEAFMRAIQDLAHGATEMSSLAEQLAQALRFIRGGNGHP